MSPLARDPPPGVQRVWTRVLQKQGGSLTMTIPAECLRRLGWHHYSQIVVYLHPDHLEVRSIDLIQSPGVRLKTHKILAPQRGKKRPLREQGVKWAGYPVEEISGE